MVASFLVCLIGYFFQYALSQSYTFSVLDGDFLMVQGMNETMSSHQGKDLCSPYRT